ncbi:MAG: hypothetical protein AAFX78_01810 [Cyanobacteria bacterium J06638_20]
MLLLFGLGPICEIPPEPIVEQVVVVASQSQTPPVYGGPGNTQGSGTR